MQTILGYLLRDQCAYLPCSNPLASFLTRSIRSQKSGSGLPRSEYWDHTEKVPTPDGDWFHVDTKYCDKPNAPTVLLCHGLESSAGSRLAQEMADCFVAAGTHCSCLNFRGCSGEPNDTIGGYHLGFTDDLKYYMQFMQERGLTTNGLFLSGYSLGANVVLKCLGELGEDASTKWNIQGAAVACAPLDQMQNSRVLAQPGINLYIYSRNLLNGLQKRAREQLLQFCDGDENTSKFDYPRAMSAKTISDFDDAFIAPIYGFEDCWDYYRQTSSLHYLDRITVPTLMVNAKDDPFMDPAVWPTEKSAEYGGTAPLKMVREETGGHLGFTFHLVDDNDNRLKGSSPSWGSVELGRFIEHLQSFG